MSAPSIGSAAPDFTLLTQNGDEVSLSTFKGKAIVLFFYPKNNTLGCTIENNDFSNLQEHFKSLDTHVIGISPDTVASHCKFIKKQNLNHQLLADPDLMAIKAYGAWGEKKNYGKTYMGLIRSTFLIDKTGVITAVWKVARVKGHAEKVLETARELHAKT